MGKIFEWKTPSSKLISILWDAKGKIIMKIAINGFGRIGKLVFRAFLEKNIKGCKIVAINELGSIESSFHLLKHDSNHGILGKKIKKKHNSIQYDNNIVKFFFRKKSYKTSMEKTGYWCGAGM